MSERTWFTSDQHFGHRSICELSCRPFDNADEMTEALISYHNERVRPGDVVWHLGDFSLAPGPLLTVLPRLNGRHRLVAGNHDGCHPCHRLAHKAQAVYLAAGFEAVLERTILGDSHLGRVLLSHLPLLGAGDHGPEERYAAWRPTSALLAEVGCTTLLHGHVHRDFAQRRVYGIACINVGVDVRGYAPVSGAELRAAIAEMTNRPDA